MAAATAPNATNLQCGYLRSSSLELGPQEREEVLGRLCHDDARKECAAEALNWRRFTAARLRLLQQAGSTFHRQPNAANTINPKHPLAMVRPSQPHDSERE